MLSCGRRLVVNDMASPPGSQEAMFVKFNAKDVSHMYKLPVCFVDGLLFLLRFLFLDFCVCVLPQMLLSYVVDSFHHQLEKLSRISEYPRLRGPAYHIGKGGSAYFSSYQ